MISDDPSKEQNYISNYDIVECRYHQISHLKYSNSFVTLMNLLNSLIGSEILSGANSFTFSGLYISVALMVLCAGLSYISTIIVIRLQNRAGAESINDLATKISGKWAGNLVSSFTLCFTYSCQVSYLVIGSETINNWLELIGITNWGFGWRRAIVVFIYSMLLPIMLTIPRTMIFLNTASTTSIFCLFFFMLVMIVKGGIFLSKNGINITVEKYSFDINIFNSLAIYALIFALPSIILPIIKTYQPSLIKRFVLIGSSFFICFTLFLIPSVIGYLMFGESVDQIILSSFDPKDIVIQILRVAFFFVVNASFPIVAMSISTDLSDIIFKSHDPTKISCLKRSIVLLLSNGPPLLIAMALPKVRPAMEVGGAFGGCLTNFFFPPFLWLKQSEKPVYHITNILCIVFSLFGIISAIIATYQSIIDALEALKENGI